MKTNYTALIAKSHGPMVSEYLKYLAALVIPLCYIALSHYFPTLLRLNSKRHSEQQTPAEKNPKKKLKSIMQPPKAELAPPKDDPFTPEKLKQFDGSDPTKQIYVAIKGTVFDVTAKAEVYGAGKSYNIFAGRDASKGFGMSSLSLDDAVADYSTLDEAQRKVLDDWYSFFKLRYNIVGKVVDP